MNSTDINHIAEAEDALQAFLGMLLGEEVALTLDAPVRVGLAETGMKDLDYLVVLDASHGFAVLLEAAWLPVLSKAMLGEPMEIEDDGAEDLMRELAGQGYGAVCNQLGDADVKLPDPSFEILKHGNLVPAGSLPDALWRVSFGAEVGDATLKGLALLPVTPDDQPAASALSSKDQPGLAAPAAPPPVSIAPATFPELGFESLANDGDNFNLLAEVELEVSVELGRRKLPLADVLSLTIGNVIELENFVGEPLEVFANGRLIAEGEAVVIDEQFGIRITRLASERQRTRAFL